MDNREPLNLDRLRLSQDFANQVGVKEGDPDRAGPQT